MGEMNYSEIMDTRMKYWTRKYDPENKYGLKEIIPVQTQRVSPVQTFNRKVFAAFSYLVSFFL